jgi:hypothetical protein
VLNALVERGSVVGEEENRMLQRAKKIAEALMPDS